MIIKVTKSDTKGKVTIPGSKSHTIRAVYIASLAEGVSEIHDPLYSDDTRSAITVCQAFGADIQQTGNKLVIKGFGGKPQLPDNIIDVGNSGTTLRIGVSTAALIDGNTVFTGDEQIRNRPLDALITALNNLGARVISVKNNGKAPVMVKGTAKGGYTDLEAVTSQYLSSLLLNGPLFENDTEINLLKLNERPYIDITLWWLNKQGINYENRDYQKFFIKGRQKYKAFRETIPGDFSSASFFLVLGALSPQGITLDNLDMTDPQGDKRVIEILKEMGAEVTIKDKTIFIRGNGLKGMDIDMNDIPDALPIMSVAGCFAEGTTRLLNVPQARLKETDRIKCMYTELKKMNAEIEELPDGLVVRKSRLQPAEVTSYNDHRIAMALTIAGLQLKGITTIKAAECVNVTFPDFFKLIFSCRGKIQIMP